MKFPVKVQFPVGSQAEYDLLLLAVMSETALADVAGGAETIDAADRRSGVPEARLIVGGVRKAEGSLREVRDLFEAEVAGHRELVVLEQLKEGRYVTVLRRQRGQ